MFAGNLILRFKDRREFRQINPSQISMNLQYMRYISSLLMITLQHGPSIYGYISLILNCHQFIDVDQIGTKSLI